MCSSSHFDTLHNPTTSHSNLQVQAAGVGASVGAQPLAAFESSGAKKVREGKYLTFDLGDECYGINIMDIREIIGLLPITPLPHMPSAFKGVINLRDKVFPVMDMRKKFGLKEMDYHARTCIIVIEVSGLSGSTLIGGIVDSVSEVLQVMEKDIEDPPKFGASRDGGFILGIAKTGKKVTILLEIDRILHAQEVVQLAQAG